MEWKSYWNDFPKSFNELDYLRQVHKTINGVPISIDDIEIISEQIINKLEIKKTDTVFDMCCGNGLITFRIADYCSRIIGIDFSRPLIQVANKYFKKRNITYIHSPILDVNYENYLFDSEIKFYMYEALQHMDEKYLDSILEKLSKLNIKLKIFLGSIPNKERIWDFHNTPEKKKRYLELIKNSKDIMGKWWTYDEIENIAKKWKLSIRYIEQNKKIYTNYYRFDVLLF